METRNASNRKKIDSLNFKPILSLLICLVLLLGGIIPGMTFEASATVFPDSLTLTQQTSVTCTLASAAMMLRARMYESGNSDWASITEASIKSVAWDVYGSLGYSWTYTTNGNSMTVAHKEVSGMTVSQLKSLLNEHPEGIVLYVRDVPHAVLVTDYIGDTFYCFEPANSSYYGRRPLSNTYLSSRAGNQDSILSKMDDYWYISSYSITGGKYLDIYADVEGEYKDSFAAFAAVDIYIKKPTDTGWNLDASNVGSYHKALPIGTEYEVRNIRGFGYQYIPAPASGITGTIGSSGAKASFLLTPISQNSEVAASVTHNGHIYERYDYHLTWTEAKAFCESKGGHLVTITSAQEQAAVEDLLSGCPFGMYYLGAADMNQSGNWSWVNGDPFIYNKWDPNGEPSKGNGEYYSAIIGIDNPPNKQTGEWIDNPNEVSGGFYGKQNCGFICEYEKTYTITYNANGGTGAPAAQTKVEGMDLRLSTDEPTRSGNYDFMGWALSPDATTARYILGDLFTVDANTTLYAVWQKRYYVNYNANGGTIAMHGEPHYGNVTITQQLPQYEGHKFMGWSLSSRADIVDYQPGDSASFNQDTTLYAVWQRIYATDWSETRPDGMKDELIETKTQYRYSTKETTTSTSSTLEGWTPAGSQQIWGDYGNWSEWSTTAVSSSGSREVKTTTLYRYYYYLCPNCGRHEPFTGTSDCGKYNLTGANWNEKWFPKPYSQCNPQTFSYTTEKRYTTSLGDGQTWCFSTGNLNDTAVGTKDTGGSAVVITTGYRYRDRTSVTEYTFERWTEWSDWSDTPTEASDTINVETRTLYRYVIDEERIMTLPNGLMSIESEAFVNVGADAVIVPNSVRSIADDAFDAGTVLIGKAGSYAELFAGWNNLTFIPDEG